MPKLLLLDGNSLLYRGFFAMRALTTASGQPTNAIYSLTMMLLTALEREKPDAVVCAWDAPVATFRHIEYADYKAQRTAPPEELQAQKALSRELIAAFRIPMIQAPGWEADDVIGSLAEREKRNGNAVVIVTGDLDAVQLVDDTLGPVTVLSTVKGLTETVVYDEAAVRNRYGLEPLQIPDYKALKGDTSDNIPGIAGIGDKTASQLIGEFGSVEALIERVGEVKSPKVQGLVRDNAEIATICKMLATIRRDAPIPDDFVIPFDYQTNGADREAVRDLFERLEFRTLLRRIPGGVPTAPLVRTVPRRIEPQAGFDFDAEPIEPRAEEVTTEPTATKVRANAVPEAQWSPYVGIAIGMTPLPEKADLMSAQPSVVAISRLEGATSIPWEDVEASRVFFEDESIPKIVHDAKLATGLLARVGIKLRGIVFDTMLAAYLLAAGRSSYRLPDIAADQAGITARDDEWATHAGSLRALEPVMRAKLKIDGLEALHDEIELPVAKILARVELRGVAIDSRWMGEIGGTLQESILRLEGEIFALANGEKFSIGSPKQLQVILFEKLGLPPGKKTKTGYSTDAEVLEELAGKGYEIARKIVSWRELTKLKTQYADALPALVSPLDGRIHTSLNQTVASTGRLSSSNPNLQNIPIRTETGREIRQGFVASPGNVLLAADYSQIELRIFAHITRDTELVRTFEAGEDIHRRTASMVFAVDEGDVTSEQRRRAKTINFAVIYGMGEMRLSAELGVDRATAGEWRKRYFDAYPGVRSYVDDTLKFAREKGYVKTLLGRRRYTPDINSRVVMFRTAAEREAANMPVQGTSADIIKLAMIRVDSALREADLSAAMVLQVHDELLFDAPPSEVPRLAEIVRDAMEHAYHLEGVPIRVEVKQGPNWATMEPVNE